MPAISMNWEILLLCVFCISQLDTLEFHWEITKRIVMKLHIWFYWYRWSYGVVDNSIFPSTPCSKDIINLGVTVVLIVKMVCLINSYLQFLLLTMKYKPITILLKVYKMWIKKRTVYNYFTLVNLGRLCQETYNEGRKISNYSSLQNYKIIHSDMCWVSGPQPFYLYWCHCTLIIA